MQKIVGLQSNRAIPFRQQGQQFLRQIYLLETVLMNGINILWKELEPICQQTYQIVFKNRGYQTSKTFFNSQAYTFVQHLIHLHDPHLNLQLKNILKACLLTDPSQQTVQTHTILEDMRLKNKQKNPIDCEEQWAKVNRLIRYLMQQQCKGKKGIQLQNIQLELQCSLNYTCPICIRNQQRQNINSMKELEGQRQFEEPLERRLPITMQFIEEDPHTKDSNHIKKATIDSIFDQMRKERQKQAQLRRIHKKLTNKHWMNIGKLMSLQRQHFDEFNQYQSSEQAMSQLLKAMRRQNINNRRMINDFCDKVKRISKIKLSRSLSIKIRQKQSDQHIPQRNKILTLRDVENDSKNSQNKRISVHNEKSYALKPATHFNLPIRNRTPAKTQKIQIGIYSEKHEGYEKQVLFLGRKQISNCKKY